MPIFMSRSARHAPRRPCHFLSGPPRKLLREVHRLAERPATRTNLRGGSLSHAGPTNAGAAPVRAELASERSFPPLPKRVTRRAEATGSAALQVMTAFRCDPLVKAEPQALGLTYFFDAEPTGQPYSVTIHFAGRRIGAGGRPRPEDTLSVTETVDPVVPGSGRLAVTARVVGVAPGQWQVKAVPLDEVRARSGKNRSVATRRLPRASASGPTNYGPVVQACAPGAHLGAWPALVGLGAAVGLTTQALLASRAHLDVTIVLAVSLAASAVGLLGAKLYYLAGHFLMRHFLPSHQGDVRPAVLSAGLCIQGFVTAAVATLVVGTLVVGLSVGAVLDVTAPGLFLGMTIGRFGCFFGGCCAGRPTASRFGLWSSDRRLGVRRIPTQLLESALALLIAGPAVVAMWLTTPRPAGVVFVGTIAAYTLGRQILFPLRDIPRKTAHGRSLTTVLAALAVVVDVALGLLA